MGVRIRFPGFLAAARVAACIAGWALLPALPADAHRVDVLAWTEGDTVRVRGTFAGSRRVDGGLVEVFDPSGRKLLEGKTDAFGEFSFTRPTQPVLRIVLTAGPGHRGECRLELSGAPGEPPRTSPYKSKGDGPEGPGDRAARPERLSPDAEKALDARLASIERRVAELAERKGPGVTEIIGGIGYIVGLMGVVLYFKSKRRG